MTKTSIKKSVLKEKISYYYESREWYDTAPDTLPVPEYTTEIFPRVMTHTEILKEYNITPYNSYQEAAAVCASVISDLKSNYRGRIVYFKENGILYRFLAWRFDDGWLDVYVREVYLDDRFDAESGVCFSNGNLDTSDSLDTDDTIRTG